MTGSANNVVRLPVNKKPPQRQKNGQDAKRFRLILEWMQSGTIEMTLAGTKIESHEWESFLEVLDHQVQEWEAEKQRARMRDQRRKNDKK